MLPVARIRVSGRPFHSSVATGASPAKPPPISKSTMPKPAPQMAKSGSPQRRCRVVAASIAMKMRITHAGRHCSASG